MLPLTHVSMLDIFGSSDYFQPVLKILIISVLMLDIFGSSDYFQPVLEIFFDYFCVDVGYFWKFRLFPTCFEKFDYFWCKHANLDLFNGAVIF